VFLDAEKAKASRRIPAYHWVDGESHPVIVEAGVNRPGVLPQLQLDVGRRGMFGDVGDPLLQDAIEDGLLGRRHPPGGMLVCGGRRE
jgi:hypothetical protein